MQSRQLAWPLMLGLMVGLILSLSRDEGRAGAALMEPAPLVSRLEKQDEPPVDSPDEPTPYAPELVKLTNAQISRIRYLELRGMRLRTDLPDKVTVRITQDVIDDFAREMETLPGYEGEKSRREFLKETPPQKVHRMAKEVGAAYADRVEITSDPEVFVAFKKNVMPFVIRTCATAGCHNSGNRADVTFRLFNDPKKSASTTYANFIILNDLVVNKSGPVINRDHPERSLLLSFLVNPKNVSADLRHPGPVNYTPAFQSTKDPRYRRIEQWIRSLKHPAEDYGVRLIKPPATAPAEPAAPAPPAKPMEPGPPD